MATKLARLVVDGAKNILGFSDGNGGVQEFVTSRFDPNTGTTRLMIGSTPLVIDSSGKPVTQDAPAAATYTHTQAAPCANWPIAHNLGKYPKILILDTAGSEVEGDIKYDNINHITLSFSSAFAGKAFCS